MIDWKEARTMMLDRTRPAGTVSVPLKEALGLVLAEGVTALHDVPPFDNSAMDGYAVRAAETTGASPDRPITLKTIDFLPAGKAPETDLSPGTAIKIMTGAPVPQGADGVVMVEVTRRKGDSVEIHAGVTEVENIRRAGEDVPKGDPVAAAGDRLAPPLIGLVAAVGHPVVTVHRRPRVGILITGDELVEPGEDLPPGKIRNSNAYSLYTQILQAGGEPVEFGVIPDDPDRLRDAFADAFDRCDIVLSSGGVSMGDLDFVEGSAGDAGAEILFTRIAQKPGKPLVGGTVGDVLFFGLPGNPVSVMVCFEVYVRPIIRKMLGFRELFRPTLTGTFPEGYRKKPERMEWVRVTLEKKKGRTLLRPSAPQGSGILRSMARGQGLAEIPKEVSTLGPDEPVIVHLFDD